MCRHATARWRGSQRHAPAADLRSSGAAWCCVHDSLDFRTGDLYHKLHRFLPFKTPEYKNSCYQRLDRWKSHYALATKNNDRHGLLSRVFCARPRTRDPSERRSKRLLFGQERGSRPISGSSSDLEIFQMVARQLDRNVSPSPVWILRGIITERIQMS